MAQVKKNQQQPDEKNPDEKSSEEHSIAKVGGCSTSVLLTQEDPFSCSTHCKWFMVT